MSVGFPFVDNSTFRRYISRKHKKPFADGFTDGIYAPKKVSRLKYTDGFLFRQWYHDLPTDTYHR